MEGEVNEKRAQAQWELLREIYKRKATKIYTLDPEEIWRHLSQGPPPENKPDMVFVANHALPTADGKGIVPARMSTPERAGEPDYFKYWAQEQGYKIKSTPNSEFEGMGDALWHPNRRLLWGGYGVRTDRAAYDELASKLNTKIIPIELKNEYYYHLDVCFAPLSESTALIQPDGLTQEGIKKINTLFETVIEAPGEESIENLSVNVEVIGDTVIMGSEAPKTAELLEDAGFEVVSINTSEFLKAGGSVCCLTLSIGNAE